MLNSLLMIMLSCADAEQLANGHVVMRNIVASFTSPAFVMQDMRMVQLLSGTWGLGLTKPLAATATQSPAWLLLSFRRMD